MRVLPGELQLRSLGTQGSLRSQREKEVAQEWKQPPALESHTAGGATEKKNFKLLTPTGKQVRGTLLWRKQPHPQQDAMLSNFSFKAEKLACMLAGH